MPRYDDEFVYYDYTLILAMADEKRTANPALGTELQPYYRVYDQTLRRVRDFSVCFVHKRTVSFYYFDEERQAFVTYFGSTYKALPVREQGNPHEPIGMQRPH